MKTRLFLALLFTFFSVVSVSAQSIEDTSWLVTIDSGRYGPVQAVISFKKAGNYFVGRSASGSIEAIREFPRSEGRSVRKPNSGVFEFALTEANGEFSGSVSDRDLGKVDLRLIKGKIEGRITGGRIEGPFTGVPTATPRVPLRDYNKVVESLQELLDRRVYDPGVLKGDDWRLLNTRLENLAQTAIDDIDLLIGFYFAYEKRPFSHLTLGRAKAPAEALIASLDQFRVGGEPVKLSFRDGVAVLRVETMIGLDTEEMIARAYETIEEKEPRALIIDIRKNGGGAFAVKPLLEHVIDKPLDAGYFVTHSWYATNKGLPSANAVLGTEPWEGYSLKAWWADVQSKPLIRLRFVPAKPNYDGPVYVLVDSGTASAAELAADAFKASGIATLVGETTAGQMLTQSPFDLAEGFQAFIPVGDYFSFESGRIEGIGVVPDAPASSAEALDTALRLADR